MKVTEAFKKNEPTLSFEFFPPKTPEQEARLFEVIAHLKRFNPDFVSVTYGAMGTTREKTFYWVSEIKKRYGIEPVAHLTCVNASRDDIARQLDELGKIGIENVLALRGDPPEEQEKFIPPANGFKYAKELIFFIKQRKPSFCLGAAGYPEGHRESPNLEKDIEFLKQKIDAGAEYIITQIFFDNRHFFDFIERCQKVGIAVPVIPGLMPITSLHQIQKMTSVCGASIPKDLLMKLEKHSADILRISVEQTLGQAYELLKAGVPGLHFFVLNQAEPISTVLARLVGIS